MKNTNIRLQAQVAASIKGLRDGKCTILAQNDRTGKIEKYKGNVKTLSNGGKLISGCLPSTDTHTFLQYRQRGKFISSATDYSIYETKKSFVKNEHYLDKDLNNRLYHTYKPKTKKAENEIVTKFQDPVVTKKHGRVFQNLKTK